MKNYLLNCQPLYVYFRAQKWDQKIICPCPLTIVDIFSKFRSHGLEVEERDLGIYDMQHKTTRWNQTRAAAARTQPLCMGHPLYQLSYQGSQISDSLITSLNHRWLLNLKILSKQTRRCTRALRHLFHFILFYILFLKFQLSLNFRKLILFISCLTAELWPVTILYSVAVCLFLCNTESNETPELQSVCVRLLNQFAHNSDSDIKHLAQNTETFLKFKQSDSCVPDSET